MSRHAARQKLAREFGATDIVTERGDEGVARIRDLTKGIGADAVLECAGTQESMTQAIRSTRPGGSVGYVRVPHGVTLDGTELFFTHVHLHGGPAPVRRYLPALVDMVLNGKINPGKVFDLTHSTRWQRATARWTSAARSRRCCARRRTKMQKRMLGKNGLEVSALGFGCMGQQLRLRSETPRSRGSRQTGCRRPP
jgi:threonine dehydrogenase-like Zn-dependent dehydrogenase